MNKNRMYAPETEKPLEHRPPGLVGGKVKEQQVPPNVGRKPAIKGSDSVRKSAKSGMKPRNT